MSGQYPGAYNNAMGGHRGQFNAQQQQQQQQQMMNQLQMGPGAMMSMGYNQGNMMQQQQQVSPMQGMQGPGGTGIGPGVMNVGMQSPSHVQQQLMQQQQMQMQQQQQQMGPQMGMVNQPGLSPQVMLQQQQQLQQAQMHQNVNMQQQSQQIQNSSGAAANMVMMAQQQTQQQQQQQNQMQQQTQQAQTQQQQMPQTMGNQGNQQQPTNNIMSISQQPHKEINIVALSRVGQETVQDITSRFQEIFTALKVIQPTANRDNSTVKKVQEHFRTIRLLFKRMRLIYERCNDGYPQGMEYATVESLIPFKDEPEHRLEATQCEEYRKALQENQELIDTVKLKNRQLREIIDRTRIIVWEINTMLSMRKS